jgi:eukaryotic-like serine/threonine-protein kinase
VAQKALAPGSIVAGRYRIVREIGRGGMGAVYVVEHVNTGGQWALKVMLSGHLDYQKAARFKREARASAKVTSEHVVKVTDADTAPELSDAPFLVMELLDGEDLEQRLEKSGPLPPGEVIEIMTQVARGLDRAHSVGVIHRDLKPENVYLHRRDDGTTIVKLLDFGISKLLADQETTAVTKTSDIFGTPLYMSPEQAGGKHDAVGPATDVWAIALLTFRILTGQIYWTGDTVPTLILQIVSPHRDLPSARHPSLGPAFDRWFLKSLADDPSDRYQSVGEQVAALTAALSATPTDEGTLLLRAEAPLVASGASARRFVGASTDGPLVTNSSVTQRRGRGLAFFGVAATGVFIAGVVYVLVLAAQPEGGAVKPATSSASTGAPSIAPDATPSSTITREGAALADPIIVEAGPPSPPSAKPYGKPRPGGKPRSASSQTDHFDTQK